MRQPTGRFGVNIMVCVIPFCPPMVELCRWLGTQTLPDVDGLAQTRQVQFNSPHLVQDTLAPPTESTLQSVLWPRLERLKPTLNLIHNFTPYGAGKRLLLLRVSADHSQTLWEHWILWWNTGYYFSWRSAKFFNFVALWNFKLGVNGKSSNVQYLEESWSQSETAKRWDPIGTAY